MAFDTYPAVDENYRFPTPVMSAIASSPEVGEKLDGKIDAEAIPLNDENLNDLNSLGFYSQGASSYATPELNYPTGMAGRLLVQSTNSRTQVTQIYWAYTTSSLRGYVRNYYGSVWSPWEQFALGDMDSKANVEALELESGTDANTLINPGIYYESRTAEVGANFPDATAGVFTVTSNLSREHVHQTFITFGSDSPRQWYRSRYQGIWAPWKQLITEERLQEALLELPGLRTEELGSLNLNDIKTAGAYSQQFSGTATLALNYPRAVAGRLLVQSNETETQVSQMFWTYDNNEYMEIYARNFYNGIWREWSQFSLGGSSGGGGGDSVFRGSVAEGADVSELTVGGIYTVPTVSVANTLINYPTKRGGIIQVWANEDTGVTSQQVLAHVSSSAPNEMYTRTKLLSSTTSWSPWTSPEWIKGRLGSSQAPVDGDTYRTIGAWIVAVPGDVTGLPGSGQGILEVLFTPTAGISLQRFTERVANDEVVVWQRYSLLVGGWSGIPWSKIGGEPKAPVLRETDVQVSDHATRVEYEASRRGGSIGTNGVPVFMWRFDHWLVAFRDKILPILEEFNLPATLNVNYDNMDNVQNGSGSITWKHVQDWNQFKGIEIANHGSTHTNPTTMEGIFHEIVEGKRNLENAMPLTPVVTWQEHGSAYLVAEDLPGDTGLNLGRTLSAFTESYAGRLVMAEHAVVEGKIGSFYPPVNGKPQIGQSHYSLDRDNETSAIEIIQYAQELGRGMTGYTHPGLMDMVNIDGSLYPVTYNEDGSADLAYNAGTHFNTEAELKTYVENLDGIVHMPTKDFREICRWLAIERDAGRLMVMTAAGGGFADKRSDHRENLFVRDSWTASGWTVSGEGPAYSAVSGSTESTLSQAMLMYTRFGWAMGAAHEILVWAKSDVSTTVTISLEANNVPEIVGAWKTEKTFEVPGDGVLHPYRLNCTIPREASGLQMSAKIIGASLTIAGEPLFAAI